MLGIIIPYFKPDLFERVLNSLNNQINKEFVVFIGDDCSPVPISHFEHQFKFNYTYRRFEKNLGNTSLVEHWKRCINHLDDSVTWFMILGDDDELSSDFSSCFYKSERLTNLLRINAMPVEYRNGIPFKGELTCFKSTCNIEDIYLNKFPQLNGGLYEPLVLSQFVFRRELFKFEYLRDYPLAWHTDDYLALVMGVNGVTVLPSAFVIVNHYNNISRNTQLRKKRISSVLYFLDFQSLSFVSAKAKKNVFRLLIKKDFNVAEFFTAGSFIFRTYGVFKALQLFAVFLVYRFLCLR